MKNDPIIEALAEEVGCYRRLAKLAAVQHDHIQKGRTEELLTVLQDRQQVIDQLQRHEQLVGPARQQWGDYLDSLGADLRGKAESLMSETKSLLEQITNADRNDVMVLQRQKLNLGARISQTSVAKNVNRKYAAAAYAAPRSRMDVHM